MRNDYGRFVYLINTFSLILIMSGNAQAGIATSKHNLSVSGTGLIKATTEDKICIFCHASHEAIPLAPLWNRKSSGAVYTPYNSSTVVALLGQPTGSSLLCLSCHDGTIALGDVLNGGIITMAGAVTSLPVTSAGAIGTNLSDDHPVSFVFDTAISSQRGELVNPGTLTGKVKLDATGQLQCTTCHDPHNNVFGKFLVKDNRGGALCVTCHKRTNWAQSPHKTSTSVWNGVGLNPWPNSQYTNVADNACQNCHIPHTAKHAERLLTYLNEEDTCTVCHNGNVGPDVLTDFMKPWIHPLAMTTGIHDPNEPTLIANRHVECVDCHNPHADGAVVGSPGSKGVNFLGAPVSPITALYQLCFRCHSDNLNLLATKTARQVSQPNIRLKFDLANPSFHPVFAVGKNTLNVPSLIPPWTTISTMSCFNCHGSDNGAIRPHGSLYSGILKMENISTDPNMESPAAYALCYSCHNRLSILSDNTFGEHSRHILGENTPCNTCHDPHGVSVAAGATLLNNVKLINFNTAVVTPIGAVLAFTSLGLNTGSCTLMCHGEAHNNEMY